MRVFCSTSNCTGDESGRFYSDNTTCDNRKDVMEPIGNHLKTLHEQIMVHLLNQSQTIPPHLRRLVYASIFLIWPTIVFSLMRLGTLSFFVTPLAFLLTVIYHIVLIVKHNRTVSRQSPQYDLVWTSTGALVCGYIICVLWTAGLAATLFRISWTISFESRIGYPLAIPPFVILEAIFSLATTSVMWALVALATHIRRNGPQKGSYMNV
ncbi:hypothetical protein DL96DRAFT_1590481 [Flagelloscypha sp. PMI_526]|nr:hypothetical protein DL96DRAFT_1590481 [Flagelloscypha sp. PMI_526]